MVAYLLRHGAQPNISALNGDTALHEAAKTGNVRIVRTLLRHNADPLVLNSRGERPVDVCENSETLAILNQVTTGISLISACRVLAFHTFFLTIEFSHIDAHRCHSTTPSTKPSSLSSSKSQRHHHHSQTDRNPHGVRHGMLAPVNQSDPHGTNRTCSATTTPDGYSDSDDTCSNSGPTTTPTALVSSFGSTGSPVSTGRTVSPLSVSGQKNVSSDSHLSQPKAVKKDPYAFEDETDESPEPSATLHPVSAVSNLAKSTSPSSRSRQLGTASTPSANQSASGSNTNNSTTTYPSAPVLESAVGPGLPYLHYDPNTPITATGLLGPPLRLRFAKEAGQYTLMEHQQNNAVVCGMEAGGDMSSSVTATTVEPSDHPVATSNTVEGVMVANLVADSGTWAAAALGQVDDGHTLSVGAPVDATAEGDNVTSQKVPPLRIKFASGTPTDSDAIMASTGCAPSSNTSSDDHRKSPSHEACTDGEKPREDGSNAVIQVPGVEDNCQSIVASTVDAHVGESCADKSSGAADSVGLHAVSDTTDLQNTVSETDNQSDGLCSRPLSASVPKGSEETAHSAEDVLEFGKDANKDTHRHRSGRTLRSHTAALREREERERHTDTTPIKKRKIKQRSDNPVDTGTHSQPHQQTHRNSNTACNGQPTSIATSNAIAASRVEIDSLHSEFIVHSEVHIPEAVVPSHTDQPSVLPKTDASTPLTYPGPKASDSERGMTDGQVKPKTCDSPPLVVCQKPPLASTSTSHPKPENMSEPEGQVSYLMCPVAPDDDKRNLQLLMFENPYEKAAALQKKLKELVNNLVEVHPKAPCAFEQYLLVSRNYLLANETPSLVKRTPPLQLDPILVELFNEQEEERYAQALKHQSEREHLRLCAEQARLRAQTRAALANFSKPLSFCSVLAYKDLTYVPPTSKNEQRDEESVRDRFTQRTFIGWLEDIRATFQREKKELLCRQLHEAESLMMVQRLDWEMKLKESQLYDYSADVFRDIPASHVPLIHVPNDFLLFPHDQPAS
ncbi:Ankyrin repeat domain-containing protein 12 [Paragonimus heterotremus]|uniref:Ankyrin repeat domain-containing protein 12 n=1 Tax=Paragonimus heterotremus TaxID=100268 RepID=A0A8J4TE96_9TREM|nr:Ankyrin repeat domain-containing protein 12 [Paragonimus heterotremus]